jgi:hyperosmotically inducible protein
MNTTNNYLYKILAHNFLIITCISAGLGLAGCQQEGPAEKAGQKIDKAAEKASDKMDSAKQSAKDKAEVAGEYIDDVALTLKVKGALAGDLMLKDSHIEVTTVNGVVTLTGMVDSEQSLGRAMELADAQKHVKSVVTNLVVNATPGSK